MNLLAVAPLWLLAILVAALCAAALEDSLRYRISNVTSLVVIAGAIAAMMMAGLSASLWQNAIVFAAILALGTVAFAAGLFGGGDVKLFAATGIWLDLRSAITLVALIFVAGGVVAVCYLASRAVRAASRDRKDRRIPYGVAIALGACALIGLTRAPQSHHQLSTTSLSRSASSEDMAR